jgi:hypothetical protein
MDAKKLFELPEILTLDGRQITGTEMDALSGGDCKAGCCDGSPSVQAQPPSDL